MRFCQENFNTIEMKKIFLPLIAIFISVSISSQTWDTIPQTIKSATQYSEQIKSADLNGDGLSDIVTAYNDEDWHGWVSVFLNYCNKNVAVKHIILGEGS